ncbi:hypothetical protein LJ707_10260 [Mucilaginibacter sp. UR6-1]|nr:galactosyltransferase-related protein [Mucilaginibacter sp. UR6-1]MCC8409317.1 hypothetical protein [Mucilaginibacter sp. UR6-1]
MNEEIMDLPSLNIPINTYRIDREGYLPLAEARNMAVEKAHCELMIFLDVDCIPAIDLVERYKTAFASNDMLYTGPIRYLSKEASKDDDLFNKLDILSRPDQIRDFNKEISYELFWSLNFGCTRSTFERIGGFDANFTGYGGEDTDFSFSARSNKVPIQWVQAVAYHQYHPSYDPPLNHIREIITNAKLFKDKWDTWPMTGWLRKFKEHGYIIWDNDKLELQRLPDEGEIQSAKKFEA